MTITELSAALTVLEAEILTGFLPEASEYFGGADVIIEPEPRQWSGEACPYPDEIHVITPHALKVSGVVERLRDLFFDAELTDHMSKFEFFGRIGARLKNLLHEDPDASASALGLAAVLEARAVKKDWTGR